MNSIYAVATSTVWGTSNAWSLAQTRENQPHCECRIELEIQGDARNGFGLIMSPMGFFTADSWHPTQQDAIDAARELFGVEPDEWSSSYPNND